MKTKAKTVLAAIAATASLTAAAWNTNNWQGVSGGSWNDPANWSLGRVPTNSDTAFLVDMGGPYTIEVEGDHRIFCLMVGYESEATVQGTVTLTGNGTITAVGNKENYIRPKRGLILDGPTVHLDNGNLMLYGPLTVKNGSTITSIGHFTMWMTAPSIYVEQGGTVNIAQNLRCRAVSPITVAGGTFTCKDVIHYPGYTFVPINISVAGGEFTAESLDLAAASSITVTDGTLKATDHITLADTVTLNLTGGTLVLPEPNYPQRMLTENDGATVEYITSNHIIDGPVTDRTVLENLNGGSLTVKNATAAAVKVFSQDGETVTVGGQLVVTNGYISFNNEATLTSDYPMFVKGFCTESVAGLPIVHTPTLVICGGIQPFSIGGEGRYFIFEGPTTVRLTSNLTRTISKSAYPLLSGDFVFDTRDWYDPTIVRSMDLRGLGAKDIAKVTIRGGGDVWVMPTRTGTPFTRFAVEEGCTLTLASLVTGIDFGPLHTEEFVMGPNTVLNIPAGSNSVHAVRWSVDPSAIINVVFTEGLTTEAKGVLCDIGGNFTPAEGQIRLVGATEGWGLIAQNGSWAVTNAAMDVTRESDYEWTGGGANTASETAANWGGTRPMESKTYIFGWEDCGATVNFHRFFQDETQTTPGGTTIQGVKFRNTAVKTFMIGGTAGITYNNAGEYANATLYSLSPVMQKYEGGSIRGHNPTFSASAEGPLVIKTQTDFQKRSATGVIGVSGDVRFGNTITFPRLSLTRYGNNLAHLVCGTRMSVLAGGSLTLTNQTSAFSSPFSGIRIEEGGTLTFNGGASAFYQWNIDKGNTPYSGAAKQTIDGTMNVNVPFRGGGHNSYGGNGSLNLTAAIQPALRATCVAFGDALNVNLSHDWVTTAAGADYPLTIKAYGTPTFRLAADWRYGPAEGASPESTTAERMAVVAEGATLTVDAGGCEATFADPVGGKGTLAVSNGVVRTAGGTAATLGVVAKEDGVFELTAGQTLRSVRCENGGVLRMAAFNPVTVKESVDLGEINLVWPANVSLAGSPRWRTVFVSKAGITGEFASTSQPCVTRVVATEDGFALQIRRTDGMVISFR